MDKLKRERSTKRILLATDLSCRCDRAFDRAVQLAQQWDATLHVLSVVERVGSYATPSWQRDGSVRERVERQIRADLGPRRVDLEVIIDAGEPDDVILDYAAELDCRLIVTGVGHDELLGRKKLGGTVDRLMRDAETPVLIVRQRAHSHYAGAIVPTDFSPCSRHALQVGLKLFPQAGFTVFHSCLVPFGNFTDHQGNSEAAYHLGVEEMKRFLAETRLPPASKRDLKQLVEIGNPDTVIAAYLHSHPLDLTVIGVRRHISALDRAIGSTAMTLSGSVDNDVLLVRETSIGVDTEVV